MREEDGDDQKDGEEVRLMVIMLRQKLGSLAVGCD